MALRSGANDRRRALFEPGNPAVEVLESALDISKYDLYALDAPIEALQTSIDGAGQIVDPSIERVKVFVV